MGIKEHNDERMKRWRNNLETRFKEKEKLELRDSRAANVAVNGIALGSNWDSGVQLRSGAKFRASSAQSLTDQPRASSALSSILGTQAQAPGSQSAQPGYTCLLDVKTRIDHSQDGYTQKTASSG